MSRCGSKMTQKIYSESETKGVEVRVKEVFERSLSNFSPDISFLPPPQILPLAPAHSSSDPFYYSSLAPGELVSMMQQLSPTMLKTQSRCMRS